MSTSTSADGAISATTQPAGDGSTAAAATTFMDEFAAKMRDLLTQPRASPSSMDSPSSSISVKLDGKNYGLWSQIVEMFVSGKDKLGFLTGESSPPPAGDPAFRKWKTEDSTVKGWLINSMDSALITNFIRYPTAKDVWRAVQTTYFDGSDASQIYDLKRRVSRLKQAGGPIDKYYNDLQGLLREIDFRRPNPMVYPVDIAHHNTLQEEDRLYAFLDGLDDRLDSVRATVLQMHPLPTLEEAFAKVRREDVRQSVMLSTDKDLPMGAAMVSKGTRPPPGNRQRPSVPSKAGKCSHCGGSSHTLETCFKLHGYPDWWDDFQAKRKKTGPPPTKPAAQASLATGVPPSLSLIPSDSLPVDLNTPEGSPISLCAVTGPSIFPGWIIDSGATDHMTPDSRDLVDRTEPRRTSVYNANGIAHPVTGAGRVPIGPSLSLSHTLLVPSLSHRLLSVSQLTADLGCCLLIYPDFCLFQDILTKETIGRGTKRDGLYFVEEFRPGRMSGSEEDSVLQHGRATAYVGETSSLEHGRVIKHTRVPAANEDHSCLEHGRVPHHMAMLSSASFSPQKRDIWLWHLRLGHPSFSYLKILFPKLFVGLSERSFQCETCILAKSHRVPYPLSFNKSQTPFVLVHSDVWGPSPLTTISGIRWFITFVDDCTRMTWVYLMKHKNEASTIFRRFHSMISTQFNAKLRILRTDNGGEYVNLQLTEYFQERGLIHETSCSQTPQQNGVAERKNRHITETARALLGGGNIPKRLWDTAVVTAVYLMNRMPSRTLDMRTPLDTLSRWCPLPSVLMLSPKVFGCCAFVHLYKNQRTKLDPCAVRCIFLGYGTHQKGYRCYDPTTKKTYVSMDVTFLEGERYYPTPNSPFQGESGDERLNWWDINSGSTMEPPSTLGGVRPSNMDISEESHRQGESRSGLVLEEDVQTTEVPSTAIHEQEQPSSPSSVPDNAPENAPEVSVSPIHEVSNDSNVTGRYELPYRHNRGKPPSRYSPGVEDRGSKYPIADYVTTRRLSSPLEAFVSQVSAERIPVTVAEAMRDSKWTRAMEEELKALEKNQTWRLVELPNGKRAVGCRWVFTIKYKPDGTIERYKARLVAKGYTQTYGVDYQETFSPVAKLNTVRVLLSLAANLDWPLHQFDVKNAFLHGNLEEEIYMDLPPGFEHKEKTKMVCRLKRSLYGLKQSPRAWFGRFSSAMKRYGFSQSNSDHTLFLKHRKNKVTALIIYVDDMIITGDDSEEILRLQRRLADEFEMKDLGGLKYFLGIEVARSKRGIFLSQRKYVLDLLAEVGMLDCRPADTPMVQNHKLGEYPDQVPANKERYQRLVGRLIYLSHTRPDIAYAVSVVSQFMHAPSVDHMSAVDRILRYLKSAPGKGLMFAKNGHLDVQGYTDADWAGNQTDRRSTSGYLTFVGGNLVTWRSKKQNVVALSSAEAEFRGISKGLCELLWLKKLLTELGYCPQREMELFCDNKAAIDISHNPVQHDRTKHVEIDRHFIKENLDAKVIRIPFVKSEDQLADVLTKAVAARLFQSCLAKLGLEDIFSPT